jgi:hypothetical protein
VIDGDEACDGDAIGGATCAPEVGTVLCTATCELDLGGCDACGNGAIDPGEDCDGLALPVGGCSGQGYDVGTLACQADCSFDLDMCCYTGVDDPCSSDTECCAVGLECDEAVNECCSSDLGRVCGNDDDCCGALDCGPGPLVCCSTVLGAFCDGADNNCCGALECDNQHNRCCAPMGGSCDNDEDCCSDNCNGGSHTCMGNDD